MKISQPSKFLFFSLIFVLFNFEGTIAQGQNISGLYLVSSTENIKVRTDRQISLYIQDKLNDSTFKVLIKTGNVIYFHKSQIVLRKRIENETIIVNNERKKYSTTEFHEVNLEEIIDLKEIVAIGCHSKEYNYQYYSTEDNIEHKALCGCKRQKGKIKYGFKLVKLE
jgi:hypothetical protein